jgi:Domain of unknown function (DUF4287)
MSFQTYPDNIKAKTGKTPDDFRALAKKKGLGEIAEMCLRNREVISKRATQ